jgi:hypothetical protein
LARHLGWPPARVVNHLHRVSRVDSYLRQWPARAPWINLEDEQQKKVGQHPATPFQRLSGVQLETATIRTRAPVEICLVAEPNPSSGVIPFREDMVAREQTAGTDQYPSAKSGRGLVLNLAYRLPGSNRLRTLDRLPPQFFKEPYVVLFEYSVRLRVGEEVAQPEWKRMIISVLARYWPRDQFRSQLGSKRGARRIKLNV